MADNKIHHCFNCGEETEDSDDLPNGRTLYICGRSACIREFRDACSEIENEARNNAEEDGFSRYY